MSNTWRTSQFSRIAVLIIFALLCSVYAVDQALIRFCREAEGHIIPQNSQLFQRAAYGYNMIGTQLHRPEYIGAFKDVQSYLRLDEMDSYKSLPQNIKRDIYRLVQCYDNYMDDLGKLFWMTGKYASTDKYNTSKGLAFDIRRDWGELDYDGLVKAHEKLVAAYKQFTSDMMDIYKNISKPSAEFLQSSNKLRPILLKNPKKWPLYDGDMTSWDLPAIYGISDILAPNLLVKDKYIYKARALNKFMNKYVKAPEQFAWLRGIYQEWDTIREATPKYRKQIPRYLNDRFAQTSLKSSMVEAMKNQLEQFDGYLDHIARELHGNHAMEEVDDALKLLERSELSALYSGTAKVLECPNGSRIKNMEKVLNEFSVEFQRLYLKVADDSRTNSINQQRFKEEALIIIKKNDELLRKAITGFNLYGMNICSSSNFDAMKVAKDLQCLQKSSSYKALNDDLKIFMTPAIKAYDDLMLRYTEFFLTVCLDVREQKFNTAKENILSFDFEWKDRNCEGAFKTLKKDRDKAKDAYKKIIKDFEEIKNKTSDGKYSSVLNCSVSNTMARAILKHPKHWPLKRDDLKFWDIPKLYGLNEFLEQDCRIKSNYMDKIKKFDKYSQRLFVIIDHVNYLNERYKKWQELAKIIEKMPSAIYSEFSIQKTDVYFSREVQKLVFECMKNYEGYTKEIFDQINGSNGGFKRLDMARNFVNPTDMNDVMRKTSILFKDPEEHKQDSILKAYEPIEKFIKNQYERCVR